MSDLNKKDLDEILGDKQAKAKLLNSFNEWLNWQSSFREEGRDFIKTVSKFGKTSAAIFLPKRFEGKTFRIFLMPVEDIYSAHNIKETDIKVSDKEVKAAEKDLEKIQAEDKVERRSLI